MTGVVNAANPPIQNLSIDDDDTAFNYQLIAGLAWKATGRLDRVIAVIAPPCTPGAM